MLWGLLAAAIPIIIHLLNRRRHKTVMWAAMQFLLKATRESRGKKRLRHILILTCRALGIAALATAAARPLLSNVLGWGSGKPDLVVLLLDRSASMEATPKNGSVPRRELALERVKSAMADLDGTRLVLIDSASGEPQDVPSPDVLTSISSTAPTDTSADVSLLASRAAEFLTETPGRAEVWIASDMQATSWQPRNDRWTSVRAAFSSLAEQPKLRVISLGGDASPNQAIRLLSSRRAGAQLVLDVEITRNDDSAAPVNLPLTATLNGVRSTSNVTLAGQNFRFRKTLPIPANEDSGYGWLSIPGDGNLRDNAAFFAYGPARPVKSLLVAPPGEATDYLALASAPGGHHGQSVERLDPAQISRLDTEGVAAIFWAAPLPIGQVAESLVRFVTEGGQVAFFPPQADSDAEFAGMKWSPVTQSEEGKFFIIDSWDHDDGLLRDGLDGTPVPADRLKAVKRRLPEGEGTTLARWDDGRPFLSRRVFDRGTAWFFSSLPDYTWSNLADADVLLPVSQRLVVEGAQRFDTGYLAIVGNRSAQPRPGESRSRLDDYGSPVPSNEAYEAGIHQFGERIMALNRPAAEDDLEILENNTAQGLFEGLDATFFEDRSTSSRANGSQPLWQAFLVAMLCFLLAEAILCLPKKSNPSGSPLPGRPTNA
ncbi:BatA domain-containing protein [Luteolibacter flavescens]|uniref:BatA domain-containing protein n=1 Tax=Luteolibacter flavescens TaxID=1859460 RepID=A0ABT3FSJ2_9BACT|nr:BatA domain-containing protein [Luteolibacter flavescens]MCW1886556.1 BatA domain-containing protein [Luteolibacter flavescens]